MTISVARYQADADEDGLHQVVEEQLQVRGRERREGVAELGRFAAVQLQQQTIQAALQDRRDAKGDQDAEARDGPGDVGQEEDRAGTDGQAEVVHDQLPGAPEDLADGQRAALVDEPRVGADPRRRAPTAPGPLQPPAAGAVAAPSPRAGGAAYDGAGAPKRGWVRVLGGRRRRDRGGRRRDHRCRWRGGSRPGLRQRLPVGHAGLPHQRVLRHHAGGDQPIERGVVDGALSFVAERVVPGHGGIPNGHRARASAGCRAGSPHRACACARRRRTRTGSRSP